MFLTMTAFAMAWVGESSWSNAFKIASVWSAGPSFCSVHGRDWPSMVKQAWPIVGVALVWQVCANRT